MAALKAFSTRHWCGGAYFAGEPNRVGMSDTERIDLTTVAVDPAAFEPLADSEVQLRVNDHGLYLADDLTNQISSQGPDPETAVENLAEAVDSHLEATADDPRDDWL